jgi:uncharacterized membrane protein
VNLPDTLFPQAWYGLGWLLFVPCLVLTGRRAPWRRLDNPVLLNAWLGSIVCLALLWQITAGIQPGLNFHFLGATLFTLMAGPRLALVGLTLVLVAVTAWSGSGWQSFGLNGLTMAALPVALSYALYRVIESRLPNNFFVYVFVTAFAGAAVAVAAVGLATTVLLAGAGAYPPAQLFELYLPYYLLLAWSEALFTGMTITLFVVYKPEWVATFDDGRYLRNQ